MVYDGLESDLSTMFHVILLIYGIHYDIDNDRYRTADSPHDPRRLRYRTADSPHDPRRLPPCPWLYPISIIIPFQFHDSSIATVTSVGIDVIDVDMGTCMHIDINTVIQFYSKLQ